jgi:hypothetical protein
MSKPSRWVKPILGRDAYQAASALATADLQLELRVWTAQRLRRAGLSSRTAQMVAREVIEEVLSAVDRRGDPCDLSAGR